MQLPNIASKPKKEVMSSISIIALYALGPFQCTGLAHWNIWITIHVHYLSGKPVEINLANFLLKIQLLQNFTLPWYLPGVQLRLAFESHLPGSCFLLRHRRLWEGCPAGAQSVQALEKPPAHQGPFWPGRPRAHRYLRSAGKACVRKPGLQSAAVCWCCRSLAVFFQAEPSPVGVWATAPPALSAGPSTDPHLGPSAPAATQHSHLLPAVSRK